MLGPPSLFPNAPLYPRLFAPQVSYTINRPFRWPWFAAFAYGVMFVTIMLLIPFNVALQGYQVNTTYEQDPTITDDLWFNPLVGHPKPGSQCEAHMFNVGDAFSAFPFSTFIYTVTSAESNDDQGNVWFAIPYKGDSIDMCDVTMVGMELDLAQAAASGTASIRCTNSNFAFTAVTRISTTQTNTISLEPRKYLQAAANDTFVQLQNLPSLGHDAPLSIGATAETYYCPMDVFNGIQAQDWGPAVYENCSSSMGGTLPPVNSSAVVVNAAPLNTPGAVRQLMQPAVSNFLQVMAALVRIDLGSRLPNGLTYNSLSHNTPIQNNSAAISAAMADNYTFLYPFINLTATGDAFSLDVNQQGWQLHQSILNDLGSNGLSWVSSRYSGWSTESEPTIQTTYQCRLTMAKSLGSAAVSVIVATLSIGSTVWALLIMGASYFAKRGNSEANYCELHDSGSGVVAPVLSSNDIEMGYLRDEPYSSVDLLPKALSEDEEDAPEVPALDHPS